MCCHHLQSRPLPSGHHGDTVAVDTQWQGSSVRLPYVSTIVGLTLSAANWHQYECSSVCLKLCISLLCRRGEVKGGEGRGGEGGEGISGV